jgi:hypothetical protein
LTGLADAHASMLLTKSCMKVFAPRSFPLMLAVLGLRFRVTDSEADELCCGLHLAFEDGLLPGKETCHDANPSLSKGASLSNRSFAIFANSGDNSIKVARRLSIFAAKPVVPEPANGSSTRPPSGHEYSINGIMHAIGFCVG